MDSSNRNYLLNMGFFVCFNIYIVFEMIKGNSRPDLQFRSFINGLLHQANNCFSLTTNLMYKNTVINYIRIICPKTKAEYTKYKLKANDIVMETQ